MISNEDLRPSPRRLLLTACRDFLDAWNRLREVRVAVAQLLSYTSAARGSILSIRLIGKPQGQVCRISKSVRRQKKEKGFEERRQLLAKGEWRKTEPFACVEKRRLKFPESPALPRPVR